MFRVRYFTLGLALAFSAQALAYYGKYSTEAMLRFEGVADIKWSGSKNLAELNREGGSRRALLQIIDWQVQHLMGSFQSDSFKDSHGFGGVLGESYKIEFSSIASGSASGRVRLTYHFEGKAVFHKKAFSRGDTREIEVRIPLAVDQIYSRSRVKNRVLNPCTDSEYNSEDEFWYFWDSELPGCPLARGAPGEALVLRLKGKLRQLPNSVGKYPEFDRLYGDNGNGNLLKIALFLGYIEGPSSKKKADHRDDAYRTLRALTDALENEGYARTDDRSRDENFRVAADDRRLKGANILRRFEKAVGPTHVQIEVLLTDSEMGATDLTFHHFLVPALEKADIVMYDGHSGLGANLDLRQLPRVSFDPRKYQIFFFNGCSTYPYYNRDYFEAKRGARSLDVVVSGLPTLSSTSLPNNLVFLSQFVNGKTPSWAEILDRFERSNHGEGTSLVGVAGEERNRFRPR